jgi:5-methyltetrahydrofolate--homocysteine methyltransferase
MAFDETGQATTAEHRVSIAKRAYKLLTEQVGFPPEDIIFDPEHPDRRHGHGGARRLRGVVHRLDPQIKTRVPGHEDLGRRVEPVVLVPHLAAVREAMHAVFLYHAIKAGLDMGIVNAGQLAVYDEIDPTLREHVEDLVLNRRPDATERLLALAASLSGDRSARKTSWRGAPSRSAKRLAHALVNGITDFIDVDVAEALTTYPQPLDDHRGPADGRHEHRRRAVRRRQDVPAAGGEERPRDEEGGRDPRAADGRREAGRRGSPRRAARARW